MRKELDYIDRVKTLNDSGEDTGAYPVLIVPGYAAPSFHASWIGKHLQARGLNTVKLELPWLGVGDMTRSAEIVAEKVERIKEGFGFEKVNLLGSSLGGLIARIYLQEFGGYPNLGRAVFLAAPQNGAYIGYLGFFTTAGRQVRPGSTYLQNLNGSSLYDCNSTRCLSIYTRWDGVIVPSESANLPYGYNLRLSWPVSHWGVVCNRMVVNKAAEFIRGDLPEGAEPGRELGELEVTDLYAIPQPLPPRTMGRVWSILFKPLKSLVRRGISLFRR